MKMDTGSAAFTGFVDLAAERLGGKTLLASDDFFAEKENLLKPGRGIFIADKYTDRGKWMDGWESRRKRTPGHDWCILRLGLPGSVRGFDIDTNHFLGNHPPYASVDACRIEADSAEAADSIAVSDQAAWQTILPRSPLAPGSQNLFASISTDSFTHLRLNIYPDGGVARFRAYGEVTPHLSSSATGPVDLAALANGGRAVACSDMFFSPMVNLIMPGRGKDMGDGWESRRRRGPGNDWVILQLARPGLIEEVEVDTNHFKGNYPDRCSLDACYAPGAVIDGLSWPDVDWAPLMGEEKLSAHEQHYFAEELLTKGPFTHVRLNIFPDGGVSRVRIRGRVAE